MTVAVQTATIGYTGNGSQTAYAVPFFFGVNSDLEVYVSGGLQTLNTHYTVTGAGTGSGTVTFVLSPANDAPIRIRRALPLTQPADYISGGVFPAETHEGALDRLTLISQQLQADASRSPRIPLSAKTSLYGLELPAAVANNLIGWDATASGLTNYTTNVASVAISQLEDYSANVAQMQLVTDPGENGTESLATSIYGEIERLRFAHLDAKRVLDPTLSYWYQTPTLTGPYFTNAARFGAVGDNVTNVTTQINNAIAACSAAGGGIVFLPAGTYRTNSTINLAANVILQGAGKGATVIKLLSGTVANTQMVTGSSIARCGLRDLTLDGNRAQLSATSGLSGVRWSNVTWSTIQNVRITGVTQHGVDASTGNNDNLVLGCDMDDFGTGIIGFAVVFLNNCHRNRILGCRSSNSLQGIGFAIDDRSGGTGPATCNHNIISGCTTDGGDVGILIQGSAFNVVEGNTVYRPGNIGIQLVSGSDAPGATDAMHNICRGNTVEIQTGVNAIGIQVTGLYAIVEGNNVRDGQDGIFVNDTTNATSDTEYVTIRGNTLTSQSSRGIYIAGGRRIIIEGNQVIESGASGIQVAGDVADTTVANILIQGNMVAKSGVHGIFLQSTASIGTTLVQIRGNHIYDPSQSSAGSYSGVALAPGAASMSRIEVTGNRTTQLGGTAPFRSVDISGSPTDVTVFDNRNWGFTDNSFFQGVMSYFQSAGGLEFQEMTSAPSAPAANRAILCAFDNGSGKTQLAVRFASGTTQIIATEP